MFNHSFQSATTIEVFDKNGHLRYSNIDKSIEPDYKKFYVELTVIDGSGKRNETKQVPFRSFVNNFAYIEAQNLYGVSNTTTCKTTANVAASVSVAAPDVMAAISTDTYGIQVGTNTNATGYNPSIYDYVRSTDYSLRNKIAHGTSTGQLSYGAMTQDTYGTNNSTLAYTRTFTNSTTSPITVKEVGLVGKANTSEYFLLARDSDGVTAGMYSGPKEITTIVGAGQILEVKYIFVAASIDEYFPLNPLTVTYRSQIMGNMLGIISSDQKVGAENVILRDGTSASVNFAANAAYKLTTAAAGTTTSGILIGYWALLNQLWPGVNDYNLLSQNTALTHSAHTVITPGSISLTLNPYETRIGGTEVGEDRRGDIGVADGLWIGSTRDFTNSTAGNISVSESALVCAGSGTSATVMIQHSTWPVVTLTPLESIRIGVYIIYPSRISIV